MGEHIQRAGGKQLQCQRNVMGGRLLLAHQIVMQILQRGRVALIGLDVLPVHIGSTAVNDGLVPRADLLRAHDLLTEGHDEVAFQRQRVLTAAVFAGNVHSIDIGVAGCGNGDDFAAQRPHQRAILALRVDDDNVMVGGKGEGRDLLLCRHGFAGAGHAENEAVAVHQGATVADDEVVGDGIDAVINAARVLDLLRLEGHEDSGAFAGQSADSINAAQTVGQHRVQGVLLLIVEDGKFTVAGARLQGFGILVKLLQTVRKVGQRHHAVHHALVALGQVIHILFAYLPHLLQLIGQRRREVVVGVLALLPAVGVGIHGHDDLIHQLDGVIHADGDNINGQHHVPGIVHQLGDHGVLDEAGILPQKQGAPKAVVHLKIALFEGKAPRRDGVLEVMTALHGFV